MIVVAGGTGRLGKALVPRLLDRGFAVRVLSRGVVVASFPPEVDVVRGDVRSRSDLDRALQGADLVVSAVQGFAGAGVSPRSVDRDGNVELISAARRTGADVVLMSVTHAAASHPMELNRMKYAAEQALVASGLSATVVRASGFADLWLDIVEQTAGRGHRPLVFGRGDNPIWWVSVDDVAEVTARVIEDPGFRGRTVEVVGPDGVTLRELAALVMESRGWPGRPRRVPRAALRVGAATVGRLKPEIGRRMAASLAMDELPGEDDSSMRRDFPDLDRVSVRELLERRSRV
jgi:uncharacterized protein YbjT (DUF2867 family)